MQARLDEVAQAAGPKEFAEQWHKQAPSTMAVPELPTNFLPDKGSTENKVQGDLFPVNFFTPHSIISYNKQVGQVMNISPCCMHGSWGCASVVMELDNDHIRMFSALYISLHACKPQ